ncbi:MAG: hypothetical protein COV41_01815 [Candidatus Brennerbacteria bacterium CG11_big_fil_rev_8_21_14_0_20_43_10]|uniref:Uncharacterized protein n=2 Tax=Candidatus Brenneribacteriota TaxID=1817902 RepID=A0A2M8C3J5_9BACT|nr:MAG: hypothetical protein COV41_01815 [Candidatus Brennerbacteria bacterium CG11_big_fil_rev_8_21_14_0_20_43_10]PJA19380.1 MAG: hypothetical protein COX61_01335 [Candidatus Brennerbacteria bacterium CG_4_10_14_0_2_um_filter_43_14]PJB50666.1 MAG: hypothetical protein CO102_00350 [Candidatus Brennerbacteria bacterium CG_4_9_14_3_um_filter_43_9]
MTIIEIFAIILATLTIAKIITILINPRAWMKLVEPMFKNPAIATIICLILAVVTGYYVLQSISIVEIGAVMLFFAFLIGAGLMSYSETLFKLREEVIEKGVRKAWLPVII